MTPADAARRLADLRQAFDVSFAAPPATRHDDLVDLLAVTVGHEPLAVPLAAMAGLVTDRVVTPLPGSPPELVGVAGLRGQLVPVYDLAALLGRAPAAERSAPRWLLLAAGSPVFAVAADRVDGHLRVPPDAIAQPDSATGSAPATGAVVHVGGAPRAVVDMPAIRATVAMRTTTQVTAATTRPEQEA